MIGQKIMRRTIKDDLLDWKKKCWTGVTRPKLLIAHQKYHNQALIAIFFIVKGKLITCLPIYVG